MSESSSRARGRFSIAVKLALSFGVLIALVSVVDWLALRQISRADAELDAMVDARWDRVQLAREAQNCSNENSRVVLQIFITTDPKEFDGLLQQAATNSRRISELIARLQSTSDSRQEDELLAAIQDRRTAYVNSYHHAIDLLVKGQRPDEARALIVQDVTPRLDAYQSAMDQYVQHQGQRVDQAEDENTRANARARRQALFLISLATLLALAIAISITGYTARQLRRRLSAEEQLRHAHQQLETKVAERTAALLRANHRLETEAAERELVERALRQSEERYRQIVDCARDTIFRTDPNGYFTFVNASAAALVKRTAGECLGVHFLELIREDVRTSASDFYRQQVKHQTPITYFEFPAVAKDGTEVWIGQNVQVIVEAGKVTELQGIARNITERKGIEDELLRSKERYRLLFEANPMPMWVFDVETLQFLAVNEAAVTHYGYSREEFLKMTLRDIRPPEDLDALKLELNFSASKSTGPRVWRHRKKDGTLIYVEVRWHALEFGGKRTKIVSINDVTERTRIEAEREQLHTELENERVRLDNIIATLPGIVWECRFTGAEAPTLTFASDYVEKMLGYSPEEWLSLPGGWFSRVHPDDQEGLLDDLAADKEVNECRWVTKDGRVVYGESRGAKIYDQKQQAIGMRGVTLDITERKLSDAEVMLQTARFHQLFENTPMGIVMVDENDVVVNANAEFERMFQFPLDDLRGRALNKLIVPEESADEAADLSRRTFSGEIVRKEALRSRKDGGRLSVEIYGVPIVANDKLVGVFAIYIDLTDQKRLELERQVVSDIIHGAISTVDLDDLFKLIHESISKVLYAENCFLALHDPNTNLMHYDFWVDKYDPPPEPCPLGVGFSSYVLQTGKPILLSEDLTAEMVAAGIVKKSGTSSPSWLGVPLRTNSRIIGVLALQHYELKDAYTPADLHFLESVASQIAMAIERKRSEQALFEANKRALADYEKLVERIASLGRTLGTARDLKVIFRALREFAVASVPCDGLVISLYDREKGTRRLEYCWTDGEEVESSNGTDVPVRDGMVGRAIKSGAVVIDNNFSATVAANPAVVLIGINADWKRDRSALAAPMTVMGRTVGCVEVQCHRVGAFENGHATAMRMAANLAANAIENVVLIEREQETEEQLRQVQKMESIGKLAGGIAHDFNNLMTAVTGYSDLALGGTLDDSLRGKIEEIKKAGERAASLTRQLLAFSRKQMLQPEVLDLNGVVNGLIKMLPRLIGEHIVVSLKLSGNLGSIKADPGQVEQVLLNLAVNSRDAMPQGGCLTIETGNVYFSDRVKKTGATIEPGHYIMLAVSDNGSGMDPETQKHIFEPFFTTKEVGKGTGLGLSTVYGIVKQSGGHVWVYSETGRGTTFKIYFPRVDEVTLAASAAAKAVVPRGTETILLVEDEEQVRNLTKEILEFYGYTVVVAENGAAGLKLGEEFDGPIDLVLTDVIMPQMSGKELIHRLQAVRPDSKVLYMSGFTDDAIVDHGVLDDGVFFLQKPFSHQCLAKKVREVLDQ